MKHQDSGDHAQIPAERRDPERALTETIDRNGLYRLVLSSMSESLAVLDSNGKIIAVNDAWTEFARENGRDANANLGVGADYLDVCQHAARTDPLAERALVGIRSVLDGTRNDCRLEYPCHSPTVERFFSMSATASKNGQGAIILHTNLTDLVRTQQELERARSVGVLVMRDRTSKSLSRTAFPDNLLSPGRPASATLGTRRLARLPKMTGRSVGCPYRFSPPVPG